MLKPRNRYEKIPFCYSHRYVLCDSMMLSGKKKNNLYFKSLLLIIFFFMFSLSFSQHLPHDSKRGYKLGYISGHEVVYYVNKHGQWVAVSDDLKHRRGTFFRPIGEINIEGKFYTLSVNRRGKYYFWIPVIKKIKGEKRVRFAPKRVWEEQLMQYTVIYYVDSAPIVYRLNRSLLHKFN